MEPRIYTYKVTFEEIPDWYWGVHKEEKYGETYLGSPKTNAWKWDFYTPHLQICEIFPHTDEGWTRARKIEDSCIIPDLNNPLCLNEHVGGLMSLEANRRGGTRGAKKLHEERDDLGRSVVGVKAAERLHEKRDDLGRSVHGVKSAERLHEEKDDLGRSVYAVKAGKKGGKKGAKNTNAQKWKDPQHPELGEHSPGTLTQMQRRRGYPHGKENRVCVK